jgi:DNA-directed RNA polymerase subunit RPC12/RpoP
MDEVQIWKERVVHNFPLIDAEKIRKAFDDGLNVYRDPKTRYKFKNPYHIEVDTYHEGQLSEIECLDSAFGSGWAAGVFERKQTCVRCGVSFTPKDENLPKTCPKCRSPYWMKPRQIKGSKDVASVLSCSPK